MLLMLRNSSVFSSSDQRCFHVKRTLQNLIISRQKGILSQQGSSAPWLCVTTISLLVWLPNTAQCCSLSLHSRSEGFLFYHADVSACHNLTVIYWTRLITTYTTLRRQKTLRERLKGVAPPFQAWCDSLWLRHEIGSTKVPIQTVEKRLSYFASEP